MYEMLLKALAAAFFSVSCLLLRGAVCVVVAALAAQRQKRRGSLLPDQYTKIVLKQNPTP